MSESTCQVLDLLVEPFTGGYQFQALSSLCQFSMKTVEDSLFQFNSNTLVTANLLPNKVFQQEAQSLIDLFTSETLNNFNRLFDLIRGTTFDNQLVSGMQTSCGFSFSPVFSLNSGILLAPANMYTNEKDSSSSCYCTID
ncbi:unnamed protein product, partial [Didymodactylos carnosus]